VFGLIVQDRACVRGKEEKVLDVDGPVEYTNESAGGWVEQIVELMD
jgi:hypothetical protein